MNGVTKLILWAAASGGMIYLAFAPQNGLIRQGPWAAIGIGLIGAAVWKHCTTQRNEDAEPVRVRAD